MKNIAAFILSVMCILSGFAYAGSDASFVYNDNGKRDPFVPLIGGLAGFNVTGQINNAADVQLQGVAVDSSGEKVAIINGEFLHVGESLGKFTLRKIEENSISFTIREKSFELKLFEYD